MSDGEGERKRKKDETKEEEEVEMPMELGMFLPKKVGESVATVQLEEIGLIRMVSERGVKRVYGKYRSETDTICIQAKNLTRHGVRRADRMKCKSANGTCDITRAFEQLRLSLSMASAS